MERTLCVPTSVLAVLAMGGPALVHIFNRADSVIDAHRERQLAIVEAQQAIMARADGENHRDLTDEEEAEMDALSAEYDKLEKQILRRARANAQFDHQQASRGRGADPNPAPGGLADPDPDDGDDPPAPAATPPARPRAAASEPARRPSDPPYRVPAQPRTTASGTFGFRNMGEFAVAVRRSNPKFGNEVDPRLRNAAATTWMGEGGGADGGFLVPPDFRTEIYEKVFGEDSLVARTDRQRSASNTITFPADTSAPWDTTGIQAYWVGEGAPKPQSRPIFEPLTVKANTLAVLVPVTEELLEDAPALDGYLRRKAPEKMDFKISDAICRGTGAGMPLGFLNSGALVTVAAEAAQTADTINATNVLKMFSRMPTNSRNTAVWLVHPDAEVQLPLMLIGTQPMYLPPGGLRDDPNGRLLGRAVIPHQVCETVGDLGDLMFVDFQQYMTLTKVGNGRDANGLRTDVSIHLWFDQDLVAYRFTIRLGGQPWWSTPIAMRDGANSMSPFIVLAAR
jgi:HK97 family phage major capsid protein